MAFTASDVKELRDRTNAGMMDCKKALTETNGDMEAAIKWLREKGMASAAKRAARVASQGAICSYIHMGGKIGVLVEVNCETDFVARCDEFQDFCRKMCLQVCSAAPRWVRREDVPQAVIDEEREICKARARETGKPEKVLNKIADGMLEKWFKETCLLEQEFNQDRAKDVETLRKELSGKLGENIVIRRFERFVLGEASESAPKTEGD
jgi:elongation factor Ts